MKWLRIDKQKPEQNQNVFYWFGFFDKVYSGTYNLESIEIRPGKIINIDYFCDRGGALGDDITYWLPRNEDDIPEHPSLEEKATCLYHPIVS